MWSRWHSSESFWLSTASKIFGIQASWIIWESICGNALQCYGCIFAISSVFITGDHLELNVSLRIMWCLASANIFTDCISEGGNAGASVHPSVYSVSFHPTFDLELLHVSSTYHNSQGIEGQGHRSRLWVRLMQLVRPRLRAVCFLVLQWDCMYFCTVVQKTGPVILSYKQILVITVVSNYWYR